MAISAPPDNLAQSRASASSRAKAEQCLEHIFCLDGPSVSGILLLLLLLLIRVWVKNEKVTVGRCINQVAVMKGEIASSEAGRFGLQGARAFAPYSPQMSNLPFLLSSNVIILYHTEPRLAVSHSPSSLLFSYPFSYPSPGFNNMYFCIFYCMSE